MYLIVQDPSHPNDSTWLQLSPTSSFVVPTQQRSDACVCVPPRRATTCETCAFTATLTHGTSDTSATR